MDKAMQTLSLQTSFDKFGESVERCRSFEPDLVVAFGAPAMMESAVPAAFAGMSGFVMGCSTAGEIFDGGVANNGLSLMAMKFDATDVEVASARLRDFESSRAAGEEIASKLMKPGLRSIFVLSPGLNVNGSDLVKGLTSRLPRDVVVTGGLAGDNGEFKHTSTLLNGVTGPDQVVAFGLYGNKVSVGYGSEGGWKPYGPARRVTKAEGSVLYELDQKPALALYKEYLGEKAAQLPASGLFYPFGILYGDDQKRIELIRTILDVDHDKQSLMLAGNMPNGARVCLMHADVDSLIEGAAKAAANTQPAEHTGDRAVLMVSCVGRKLVMGADIDEEVETVAETIGSESSISGFYSYGEIAPLGHGEAELHNETVTLTLISESAG
jgi:hypothetical protein